MATTGPFNYGIRWPLVALTVGLALMAIVTFGSMTGSMLPFVLKRFSFDPATDSTPFVATLVEVTGLVIYFTVAYAYSVALSYEVHACNGRDCGLASPACFDAGSLPFDRPSPPGLRLNAHGWYERPISRGSAPMNKESKTNQPALVGRLGPGLITGAADDDPSGIATYS